MLCLPCCKLLRLLVTPTLLLLLHGWHLLHGRHWLHASLLLHRISLLLLLLLLVLQELHRRTLLWRVRLYLLLLLVLRRLRRLLLLGLLWKHSWLRYLPWAPLQSILLPLPPLLLLWSLPLPPLLLLWLLLLWFLPLPPLLLLLLLLLMPLMWHLLFLFRRLQRLISRGATR